MNGNRASERGLVASPPLPLRWEESSSFRVPASFEKPARSPSSVENLLRAWKTLSSTFAIASAAAVNGSNGQDPMDAKRGRA